jgi:gliding motility-associated-like protein
MQIVFTCRFYDKSMQVVSIFNPNLLLMKGFIAISIFFALNLNSGSGQLVVDNTLTPNFLVDNVLLGPGVVANNIQYTGQQIAYGYFQGGASNIGLNSGILFTTGRATDAIGPNDDPAKSFINQAPGDPLLDALFNQNTMEASRLEFDFIPSSDTVRFRYVFASEEYSEGVCTPYNDLFGFYISGPGIIGVQNIALIPGSTIPVSISSVNGGILGDPIYGPDPSFPFCNLGNTSYYVDNTGGATVQFDGWTIVLEAKAAVIPCETYHIIMVVAEANDPTFDTGVFIEAGSFNSQYIDVSTSPEIVGATMGSAAGEGCSKAIIHFERYDDLSQPRTLSYTLSGNVSPSDYQISSPQINFSAGQNIFDLEITPLHDNLNEGIEELTIDLIADFTVCSMFAPPRCTIQITDLPKVNLTAGTDTSVACGINELQLFASASGGYGNEYHYQWSWPNGSSDLQTVSVVPYDFTVFEVRATDTCGIQFASEDVRVYCGIYVPNTITPNGDGINDQLTIYNGRGCSVNIFDRWGTIIYSNLNYDDSWSANGIKDGVYNLQIKLRNDHVENRILNVIR